LFVEGFEDGGEIVGLGLAYFLKVVADLVAVGDGGEFGIEIFEVEAGDVFAFALHGRLL
jgi:hypothetical protein